MDRCLKDEPTAKNLVSKNWKNLLGGSIPPPLAIGGLKSLKFAADVTDHGSFQPGCQHLRNSEFSPVSRCLAYFCI